MAARKKSRKTARKSTAKRKTARKSTAKRKTARRSKKAARR